MNQANPAELLELLQLSHQMAKAGILFVPVPVVDRKEYAELMKSAAIRMIHMQTADEAEENGGAA